MILPPIYINKICAFVHIGCESVLYYSLGTHLYMYYPRLILQMSI